MFSSEDNEDLKEACSTKEFDLKLPSHSLDDRFDLYTPNRLCPNRHHESFQLQHLKSRILPIMARRAMKSYYGDAGYLRSIYWDVMGYPSTEKAVVPGLGSE